MTIADQPHPDIPNPNHPKLGDTIKVQPIRTVNAINNLKKYLAPSPRNFALFVVGINTAYRASELLSIRLGQIRHLLPGDRLEVKQKKTNKYRAVTMNIACYDATQKLLEHLDRKALRLKDLSWVDDDSYLFAGRRPDAPLTVPTLNNLVKDWCRKVNLKGNYGSHSLRKTWGYMQRTKQDTPIPLLMQALGHASQQQTLAYLCIQDEEIESIYTALLADTVTVGLTDRRFEKEEATTYELGLKRVSASGLLNYSAAIFRTDFDNQQFFFVDTVNVARIIYTIPKTRINGVELELNVNPTEGLDFRAGLGIADGMIKDGGEFAPNDVHSPNSHGYTFNLTGQYLVPISESVNLRTRLEYERRGPIYYDPQNTFKIPSTDFINAYVGFEWDRFSVSVFGRNLTDERIPTFFGVDGNGPSAHAFFQNLLRTFGIQAAARF